MRILILGASGQFGVRLCRRLSQLKGIHLFLGGRDKQKLDELQDQLIAESSSIKTSIVVCNANDSRFVDLFYTQQFDLLIHLAGPFQGQGYNVAKACLQAGLPYIDMADGRDFVSKFSSLDADAREKNIALITGASTVPGLSSAIIDAHLKDFSQINALDYGIGAGLKTGLGLATLQAVLSYCGKPYEVIRNGTAATIFGLDRPRFHDFLEPIGRRYIVDCDIPDHSLFPTRYPTLKHMDFGSCIDAPGLAQVLCCMSKCVHNGWITNWGFMSAFIKPFMDVAKPLGSPHSGFFMYLEGVDGQQKPKKTLLEILARDGSGLEIPITPVVLLVKRMLKGETLPAGAYPCMGLFSLVEFEHELSPWPITWNLKDVR